MTSKENTGQGQHAQVDTSRSSTSGQGSVIMTIKLSRDDADRVLQAFKEGTLADIGVLEIQQLDDTGQKQWAASEEAKMNTASDSAAKHRLPSK